MVKKKAGKKYQKELKKIHEQIDKTLSRMSKSKGSKKAAPKSNPPKAPRPSKHLKKSIIVQKPETWGKIPKADKPAPEQEERQTTKPSILDPKFTEKMPLLETNVDRLLDLVLDKKTISVSKAAQIFKLPGKKIEEWGKILESHGLIDIHYPAFGKPILRVKVMRKKRNER